ncbi:MAG: hypothetical protein IKU25_05780 [Clostridia bacterium]|nr:hypothetical protein [Clostridia bacterium]
MTTSHIILSIIEFLAIVLTIVALFNETKIAKWERRVFKKICLRIIKAYDARQAKKSAALEIKKGSPKLVYAKTDIPSSRQHYVA